MSRPATSLCRSRLHLRGVTAQAGCRRTLVALSYGCAWNCSQVTVTQQHAGYKAFMPLSWRMCSMNTNMSVVCGPRRA